jgi:hypothetical protein
MTKKDIRILKTLLLGDIQNKYRKKLWMICCGIKLEKINNEKYYDNLTKISAEFPSCYFSIQIDKDLNRSKYKKDVQFINKAKRILNNFSLRCPTIGYCQGFNFIIEFILSVIDDEVSNNYFYIN